MYILNEGYLYVELFSNEGYLCVFTFLLAQELGLPGVQIGSHINRWNWDLPRPEPAEVWDLDAPELQCVFATAEEIGAAVFVHPWGMDQSPRMKKYWMPWLVGEDTKFQHYW